jgi:hypothetical protein
LAAGFIIRLIFFTLLLVIDYFWSHPVMSSAYLLEKGIVSLVWALTYNLLIKPKKQLRKIWNPEPLAPFKSE